MDLEAEWPRFASLDVELVSIMVDPLSELAAEARSLGLNSAIASDAKKEVSTAYDAMEASMHPGVKPGHTFVLVNKVGRIVGRSDWIGHGKPMYMEVDDLYSDVAKWLERSG